MPAPSGPSGGSSFTPSSTFIPSGRSSPRFGRRARVLCDYEARSPDELDLTSDEVWQAYGGLGLIYQLSLVL